VDEHPGVRPLDRTVDPLGQHQQELTEIEEDDSFAASSVSRMGCSRFRCSKPPTVMTFSFLFFAEPGHPFEKAFVVQPPRVPVPARAREFEVSVHDRLEPFERIEGLEGVSL